ncbi:hypothetical protein SBA1_550025 [Candidatus Sulfotelmatobacter kueseliae]|uniref:Uncharacterized protein n=1 Tax=Candidatus Sulfotelmatobacter kueseliae TaxID=2042962 RepID=A0A2U3KYI6_9BACT|nr:hypothetical protein SBA1_550025 [Candidatus Sulfotelmatobacter kueseliae]
MAFEVYTRTYVRTTSPKVSVSNFGRIGINNSASDFLTKTHSGFVILLWDKATNRVGIQPVKKEDDKTYPIKAYGPKGKGGTGFSAVTFLNFIRYDWTKTRSFPAEWLANESMLVFTIPQEHLNADPQQLSRRKVHARKGE